MADARQRILCRVPPIWHSAKFILKIKKTLPSARSRALGKEGEYTSPAPFFLLLSLLSLSRLCHARRRLPAAIAAPRRSRLAARRASSTPRPPAPAPALAGARARARARRGRPRRRPPVRLPRPRRRLPARRRALTLSLSRAAAAATPATPSADHARPLRPRHRPTASVPLARPRVPSTPSAAACPLRRRARAAVPAPLAMPSPPTPRATTAAGSHLLARRHRLPATRGINFSCVNLYLLLIR
jgi:hypothetical protein